ncbi:MAG: exonuclease subunit SbcC [Drouetiella hepatica Uher 2000/2452]|uniref:Nuclease SbcCD subunit C n=1 Tax=Drouetiella hepatica Uher 2000/2452 TaxID=904376 RepID=A0A951QBN9_9CYAN|nr:exonuclease subunit SbcC [Drouetiella hepatica Uher 2000/2452]
MIPLQLTLKNFLSYREATLDFRGLHVACICGANGAGKSSLLEAIAWAVWGESRALTEDDVIHLGSTEALIDFIFQCRQQTYRIIRSRYRGQSSTLEFQIQTPDGFRSLTEKGVRATQQIILQHLKLDYDTFINSAYLRQGRADEFMLKRPTDRKQILADLLKLDRYDELAEQAKEKARQFKAELTLLERNVAGITTQLEQVAQLEDEETQLTATIAQMQQQQQRDRHQHQQLQALHQQRQTWLQQLGFQQQQQQQLTQDCRRLQQDLAKAQQQQQDLQAVLREQEAIVAHYARLQRLQQEEELQSAKFQTHQTLHNQRQQLQQQKAEQESHLTQQLQQVQAQLEALHQQQQEIQQTLTQSSEIAAGLEQLRQARIRLTELDHLQMKATPLLQRRQQLQTRIDRAQTRLAARLEELESLRRSLEAQQQRQPQLHQAVLTLAEQIEHLEQRRAYQEKVRDKGIERRTFLERLQEQQRECERDLSELDHKLLMLQKEVGREQQPVGALEHYADHRHERASETSITGELATLAPSLYPPCPLCDRPLDEPHWQLVLQKHRAEHEDTLNQIWVLREQLTTSDREIKILRQEYRELDKELSQREALIERRGKLQEQLQGANENQVRLQQIAAEQAEIERSLQQQDYATEFQELRLLEQSLGQLSYDDKNHALARGQVDRWRWAEIKQAEAKQAQKRQAQIAERQPVLEATLTQLEQQLAELARSPLQRQIEHLEQQMAAIGYDLEQHTALRQSLRQAQPWQLRYRELVQAQQHYPQLQQQVQELNALWSSRKQALQSLSSHVQALEQEIQQAPDANSAIAVLEQQIQQQRQHLDDRLSHLGRIQQQRQQLEALKMQHSALSVQLQTARHQMRIHQELAQAFGKNGLQALMIENVLPQLEAETNQILGRLSANQLHVQFVTQRARKGSQRDATKLIDTLDILISDVQGTRPYETYSGGEAFRINFAIRLALARLLAQRSGTALQLLVIDEGFGTQDEAGCDRLITAINAIAADFACILTVTHMPHLKEAFQTRIEVYKTEQGSQVSLVC